MKTLEKSKLQLVIVIDKDNDGNNITKPVNFNQLSAEVSDEDAKLVGQALGNLQKAEVEEIRRIDDSLLA